MKRTKMTIIGEYNEDGYVVMMADGKVLHSAGANAVDSHAPGRDVSLATIRRWCIKTGKEIAKEIGAVWCGAERKEYKSSGFRTSVRNTGVGRKRTVTKQ